MRNFDLAGNENPSVQFCLLAYSPSQGVAGSSPDNQEIILLLASAGETVVLIDPEWRNYILPPDRDFFEDLLSDLRDRSKRNPRALIRQTSQLNLGPLVTHDVGFASEDDIRIAGIIARFVPLSDDLNIAGRTSH